jgi:hypothetical protein
MAQMNSANSGPGTVSKGAWVDGKLNIALDFDKHTSIAVAGNIKEGKLLGEFRTE